MPQIPQRKYRKEADLDPGKRKPTLSYPDSGKMAYKGAEQGMTSVTETPIQGSEQFMQSSE